MEVDNPDDAIDIELFVIGRGKMESNVRGISPIEQASGESVMLGYGEEMPDGIEFSGHRLRIFPKVSQHVPFELPVGTPEAHQGCFQRVALVRQSSIHDRRPISADFIIPRILE